jgi:pyrroline-5-carboxylate reductase
MKRIGFIGIGNMGGALLEACVKVVGDGIMVSDLDTQKVESAKERLGCIPSTALGVAAEADYIFLCVKPQAAESVMTEIGSVLAGRRGAVLVSIMAGVTMEKVRALAGGACPVIRIMPNVAAAVGEGMILCTSSADVTAENRAEFEEFMARSGKLDWMPESLIDAATAISGCGPAFLCLFVEAMADGGVKCGVPRKKALEYAIQTLRGTAELLEQTGKHPAVVKDEVTSPGGSTIEGVEKLEEGGLRAAVMNAVVAAYEKNGKLK